MNNITSKKEKVNIETIKNDKIVKLPWVPKLGPKLREEFKRYGIKTIFTSGRNLKNLICRNKSKLLTNSFPGVYQLDTTCNTLYIGKTKKKVITKTAEHQQDNSWSKYQDDKRKIAQAHTKIIPMIVKSAIRNIFMSISNVNLLKKMSYGKTQNNNERINALLWKRCPKDIYVGLTVLEIGTASAVINFSESMVGMVRQMGYYTCQQLY